MSAALLTSSVSKGEKLAQRLSYILARLHQGDALDKHHLAQDFQVYVRTIERDLGERLSEIVERSSDGQWQLTHSARSSIPAKHLHGYARTAPEPGNSSACAASVQRQAQWHRQAHAPDVDL